MKKALRSAEMVKYGSLYLHFPFCETKCHYCDFYSIGRERTRKSDHDRFKDSLRKECELRATSLSPTIDTLFLGGGTPSMTDPSDMQWALEPLALHDRPGGNLRPDYEWTMEANPSSVDPQRLSRYRELGVNRVSMGVQAMDDGLLKLLGRVHSRHQALQALDAIFSTGFTQVSVDLICGVPDQTTEMLRYAIAELTKFPITHLSCYLLTLPKQHALAPRLPNEDRQLEHLLFIHHELVSRGFRHYEISNFAKPGGEARHNLAYWKGHPYLGFGPSAHSFDPTLRKRWKNVSSLHRYGELLGASQLPVDTEETLTEGQMQLERWLLALRLDEGIPASWLESSNQKQRAKHLQAEGLVEAHPEISERIRLTPKGFALSDSIIAALSPA